MHAQAKFMATTLKSVVSKYNCNFEKWKMTYVSCFVQTFGPWSVGSMSLCSSALFSSRPTLLRLRLWLAKTGSGLDPSSLNVCVGPWPETVRIVKERAKARKMKIETFRCFRRVVAVAAAVVNGVGDAILRLSRAINCRPFDAFQTCLMQHTWKKMQKKTYLKFCFNRKYPNNHLVFTLWIKPGFTWFDSLIF